MNEYIRSTLLGGWHLLPEVQSERPKEVVREKPVWVDQNEFARRSDFAHQSSPIKAAAHEPAGCECGFGNKSIQHTCSAAAPIDGFRVGDCVIVERKIEYNEHGFNDSWVDVMDKNIGRVAYITSVDVENGKCKISLGPEYGWRLA